MQSLAKREPAMAIKHCGTGLCNSNSEDFVACFGNQHHHLTGNQPCPFDLPFPHRSGKNGLLAPLFVSRLARLYMVSTQADTHTINVYVSTMSSDANMSSDVNNYLGAQPQRQRPALSPVITNQDARIQQDFFVR